MAIRPARAMARLATPATEEQAPAAESWGARRIERTLDADALTPARIKTLLVNAESGDLESQAELFELMEERDGELAAHLRTRKAGVAQAPWAIEPADDSPEADRAAEFARETVEGLSDVDDALMDLLDAVGKGYSVVETLWETSKSAWTPTALVYRPQRWFTVAADGRTLQILGQHSGDAIEMNPLNFIVHRAQAQSGFAWRIPLLRSCVRAFVVRAFSWKDWMAFAEVFGMPLRVGYLREGVDYASQEATAFWAMLRALGTDMAAMIPEGNRIEFPEVARGTQPYEAIIERAGRELTLAVLGQTLTSGGEGGGSYALGQVHNAVRLDLVMADAHALGRTLTDILDTPVSPELLPPKDGEITQSTEALIGPYELHDFFLWHLVRNGPSPRKILRLTRAAFGGVYDDATIRRTLALFLRRFFAQQFKRSCLPDGPKVTAVSLSPRSDWRMPSDASADLWLSELNEIE